MPSVWQAGGNPNLQLQRAANANCCCCLPKVIVGANLGRSRSLWTVARSIASKSSLSIPPSATTSPIPLPLERGEMQYVWDVEGKRYLDFFGGIVTVGVGHANPRITGPRRRRWTRSGHTSTLYPHETDGGAGGEDRADHSGPAGKILLHQYRLRGQRDRHRLRPHAYGQSGDRRTAPLLQRPLRASRGLSPASPPGARPPTRLASSMR